MSATHLATTMQIMIGRSYGTGPAVSFGVSNIFPSDCSTHSPTKWMSPLISTIITVSDMVSRDTPPKKPAAPSNANTPFGGEGKGEEGRGEGRQRFLLTRL